MRDSTGNHYMEEMGMRTEHELWMNTIDEIDVLLPKCARTIGAFYHVDFGFRSKPENTTSSIISHAACVETSTKYPLNEHAQYSSSKARDAQLEIFLNSPWNTGGDEAKEIAYSVSFAIPAFTSLCKPKLWEAKKKVVVGRLMSAIGVLNDSISDLDERTEVGSSHAVDQEPLQHGMFLYRLRRALYCLENEWADQLARYKGGGDKEQFIKDYLKESMEKLDSYMKRNLYYFLSMCSAIPDDEEDALQLGYIAYSLSKYSGFGNAAIIEHAVSVVLSTLVSEHRIPRLQVLYRNGKLNIAASPIELLRLLAEMREVRNRFSKHWKSYDAAYNWLVTTEKDGLFKDDLDAPSWMEEPWRGEKEPEAWLNAVVVEYLLGYKELLRVVCSNQFVAAFRASTKSPSVGWDRIADLGGFKTELDKNLISPITEPGGSAMPLEKASVILFGPPGTAKTTIARALASKIRWPFIELLPHDFAEEGTEGVIRLAKMVFRKLLVMRKCVVFFDEIDELVRERVTENEKIGRFITTSVLPWFQTLRSAGEVVFVVATNEISLFDPAIRRQGRFDYVIPVGPPEDKDQRRLLKEFYEKQWKKRNKSAAGIISVLVDTTRTVIDDTKVKCRLLKDKEAKGAQEGDDPYAWPITLLELLKLTEHVATKLSGRKVRNIKEDCKDVVSEYVEGASEKPVIAADEYWKFVREAREYGTVI